LCSTVGSITWSLAPPGKQACLDFANTVDWHSSDHPVDSLIGYPEFVNWAKDKGLIGGEEAARLLKEGRARPNAAAAALNDAKLLRESIYRILVCLAKRKAPAHSDVTRLNGELEESLSRIRVLVSGGGPTIRWSGEVGDLRSITWLVAKSALDLLTSDELGLLKECANEEEGCGWLFLDRTKNRSRRWCSMDSCGNRAKARRHYERGKAASGHAPPV
jgi:predicted RNA-binding Zn ribbon-like protein